jgi:tetratricopeptide (TPR) repeat protein
MQGISVAFKLEQVREFEYRRDPSSRGREEGSVDYSVIDEEEILQGLRLLKEGNFDRAKLIFEKQNSRYNKEELQFYLALARLNSNEVDKAISSLENLAMDKESTIKGPVNFNLALAYLKSGQRKKAREILQSIVSLDTDFKEDAEKVLRQTRWP